MDEEQRIQGSQSADDEEFVTEDENPVTPVTASGDGFTDSETESVTEQEADHEDPVTSVTEIEAEHENPVTSVTENEAKHENPVTSVTNGKPDTKVIRVTVPDLERIMLAGYEDEKPATVLHRLLGEMDALQTEVVELRRNVTHSSSTEIIPGQQAFSLKDAIASLKDVCDDDTVRLKFAAKMLETQAAATNSHLAREHDAEQKRLDRADKDKDRDLKEKLASSRAEHDKDMTMIKKGMVKQSDLEDIVFLGQKSKPADRIKNQKELAARQAAHEEDETGNLDPPGEDPAHD